MKKKSLQKFFEWSISHVNIVLLLVGFLTLLLLLPSSFMNKPPVASLDPKAANLIMSLLKKINKDFNMTIICNLHQIELASKYSDRIVGLLDGSIMFDKSASNINKTSINHIYK